jgi:MSHA biogenesis protein MshI
MTRRAESGARLCGTVVVGRRAMRTYFRRKSDTGGQTGIHRSGDGVAVAQVMKASADRKPRLTYCTLSDTDQEDALTNAARRLPNKKFPAVSVLAPSSYSMLLVEAPDVPQDELRAAVRWRVKDLLDFHIDDAIIDVFQMPSQGRGGPNQMMYAIAARSEGVRSEVDAAEDAGINLQVIDVLELSLRNIALLLEEDSRGVALLYLGAASGVLLLVKKGILYLTRRIETGVDDLNDSDALRSQLVAGLALEARRSLDYFESHYEQSAIPVLYTAGLESWDHDQLAQELGISVRNLELATLVETDLSLTPAEQRSCLPAIGAALRNDEVAL